jgi:hypothetical protein
MTKLRIVFGWLRCLIGDHDWTSHTQRGQPIDQEAFRKDPIGYYNDYIRLRCVRSGCTVVFPYQHRDEPDSTET